jgi:hypothetical protein
MKAAKNLKVWHPGDSGRQVSHIENRDTRGKCYCGVKLGVFGNGLILHTGEEIPDVVAARCRQAALKAGAATNG